MITRIRYKTDKGIMTSVTPLFAQTTLLTVRIDLTKMHYQITDDEGNRIESGISSNKQKILTEVKNRVKKLGVLFHDEIRPRKIKKIKDAFELKEDNAKVSIQNADESLEVENVTSVNNLVNKFLE
jgi:cell division protein FtsL